MQNQYIRMCGMINPIMLKLSQISEASDIWVGSYNDLP